MKSKKQIIRITTASQQLDVTRRTIYRYIRKGVLEAHRVPGTGATWVTLESVKNFETRLKQQDGDK